ncbi:hypothetical protein HDU76_013392 [Blyttiomyces sp. JEL0837]|nr:hypothetical protein HDU76_013392 [Blyttiomyces sp. JEL0837]
MINPKDSSPTASDGTQHQTTEVEVIAMSEVDTTNPFVSNPFRPTSSTIQSPPTSPFEYPYRRLNQLNPNPETFEDMITDDGSPQHESQRGRENSNGTNHDTIGTDIGAGIGVIASGPVLFFDAVAEDTAEGRSCYDFDIFDDRNGYYANRASRVDEDHDGAEGLPLAAFYVPRVSTSGECNRATLGHPNANTNTGLPTYPERAARRIIGNSRPMTPIVQMLTSTNTSTSMFRTNQSTLGNDSIDTITIQPSTQNLRNESKTNMTTSSYHDMDPEIASTKSVSKPALAGASYSSAATPPPDPAKSRKWKRYNVTVVLVLVLFTVALISGVVTLIIIRHKRMARGNGDQAVLNGNGSIPSPIPTAVVGIPFMVLSANQSSVSKHGMMNAYDLDAGFTGSFVVIGPSSMTGPSPISSGSTGLVIAPAPAPAEVGGPASFEPESDFNLNSKSETNSNLRLERASTISNVTYNANDVGSGLLATTACLRPLTNNVVLSQGWSVNATKSKVVGYNSSPAWSVEYNTATDLLRPLRIRSSPEGAGGLRPGSRNIRMLGHHGPTSGHALPNPDWVENKTNLIFQTKVDRWNPTTVTLPDGRLLVIGGSSPPYKSGSTKPTNTSNTIEYLPSSYKDYRSTSTSLTPFPFLDSAATWNLQPIANLLSSGRVMVFANSRSVLLQPDEVSNGLEYNTLGMVRWGVGTPADQLNLCVVIDDEFGDRTVLVVSDCPPSIGVNVGLNGTLNSNQTSNSDSGIVDLDMFVLWQKSVTLGSGSLAWIFNPYSGSCVSTTGGIVSLANCTKSSDQLFKYDPAIGQLKLAKPSAGCLVVGGDQSITIGACSSSFSSSNPPFTFNTSTSITSNQQQVRYYELPELHGPARTYPWTGSSLLLPLDPSTNYTSQLLICGGASTIGQVDSSCGLLTPDIPGAQWDTDGSDLLSPRIGGSMIMLPDGTVLLLGGSSGGAVARMINSTGRGTSSNSSGITNFNADGEIMIMDDPSDGNSSLPTNTNSTAPATPVHRTNGWYDFTIPNLAVELYMIDRDLNSTTNPPKRKWIPLVNSTIPRLGDSTATLLPDGRVMLIGGTSSNEFRVEYFYPPYLTAISQGKAKRPMVSFSINGRKMERTRDRPVWEYGGQYQLYIDLEGGVLSSTGGLSTSKDGKPPVLEFCLIQPGFHTRSFSHGQRMVWLVTDGFGISGGNKSAGDSDSVSGTAVRVLAPPSAVVAPPGWYLLFAVLDGIPSVGRWIEVVGDNGIYDEWF